MKFIIDDIEVIFPYKFLYKEQLEYMQALKQTLDEKGHGILEMPTGTGKTVSLLAFILAYLAQRPNTIKKLIYCTRTVVEMEKTLEEVRLVMKARKAEGLNDNFTAVGLSSRRNLCINPDVVNQKDRVDSECRKRTAEWVKRGQSEICIFYDNFEKSAKDFIANLPNDVYSLSDLRKNGGFSMQCPYYTAREMVKKANIVVYNYLYLIDPGISSLLSKDYIKESVVVFDEAHNIDDVCIEAYTVRLNKPILAEAINNLKVVETQIQSETNEIQNRLNEEYKKLIKNLEKKPEGELNQLVIPGQIRKARNFIDFMKRIIQKHQKHLMLFYIIPKALLKRYKRKGNLDIDSLKQCGERLNLLLNTLQIAETDKFRPLSTVAQFVIRIQRTLNEKLMTLACFDSSLAMKNIFASFQSVILTSGTMSPIDIYPKILDFKPVVAKSIDIELTRNSIQPIIVTMSEDGTELTSEFTFRNNEDVSRNYGNFLLELSENVPDGLIVFMPSYSRMEEWARQWQKDKYLEQISKNKVLLIESKDVNETSQKLQQYRKCCDVGRGAALFSIARGKIAEGIDFEGHYGRCVAVIGFPALNSKDTLILERCKFLEEKFKITKNDFIEFDAMRQTCQCLGRVLRGKQDYGIMIMADKRFAQKSKLSKMPRWIYKQLDQSRCLNITSETAITVVRDFFRQMAQPFKIADNSYFTQDTL
ncbi:unnamed protein product (macronuclear) [Paramecium tetraurelia]|uniref:DNA 5'-3' helicase n=1 Tax=Paramecium tetraurelia TaxID=5888 RepID=A0C5Z5_PARTE|nr:uncharacterized protein GSPATT00035341001 [Paramecium tetraurelia]CAK66212.1 unnamed protein product [Paramecium tetraurelia]|eukprot:XP_001433609.1 hypothetical protein (macronuclear) [Paramecium tetraurelia strain d4-2]